jgi:hypothetical protein
VLVTGHGDPVGRHRRTEGLVAVVLTPARADRRVVLAGRRQRAAVVPVGLLTVCTAVAPVATRAVAARIVAGLAMADLVRTTDRTPADRATIEGTIVGIAATMGDRADTTVGMDAARVIGTVIKARATRIPRATRSRRVRKRRARRRTKERQEPRARAIVRAKPT